VAATTLLHYAAVNATARGRRVLLVLLLVVAAVLLVTPVAAPEPLF
jgi:hypothetical protein